MISGLLRSGVLLSVALVLFGTLLTLVHHPDYLTNSTRLDELRQGTAGYPATVGEVFQGVLAFEGRSFVMLGLLVLIATPVARVAVSTLAFLQLGDRFFAFITTCVLSLLVVALVLGKAGG
jgi:uncharacterized membrane protein